MRYVRAKKHLGQHFLTDNNVAQKVVESLSGTGYNSVLEIGAGTGILTKILQEREFPDFRVIEIDTESVSFLRKNFPGLEIIEGDFMKFDLRNSFQDKLSLIGNFPYNISSQILFKTLENRDIVMELVGMFQKEVAERICAGPGSKTYGILSVLLKAYYKVEYLFDVAPGVFNPPPKVQSAVVSLSRCADNEPDCDVGLFFRVVKAVFNHRRKMIRNSIKPLADMGEVKSELLTRRPEQMGIQDFYLLTNMVGNVLNSKS